MSWTGRRATVVTIMLVFILTGSVGCRSASQSGPVDQHDNAAQPVPSDFRMVCGEGGGFAGRWQGYTIRADGTVLVWEGRYEEEETEARGALTPDQLSTLWKRIDEVDFFEQEEGEPGNITAFIQLTANDQSHRVAWIPSVEEVEPVSSPVEALYRYCRDVAREAIRNDIER